MPGKTRRVLFTLICLVVACAIAYTYRRHRRRHHAPPPPTIVAPQPAIANKVPLTPDPPPAAKAPEDRKH